MAKTIHKLMTANDPMFAPNMIWKYVVVTERINKIGNLEVDERVCVDEDDVAGEIKRFLEYDVANPDAVKGVHYNYAVFNRNPYYVYTGEEPVTPEVPFEEAVNKRMRDLSKACLRLAGDEL